MRGGVPDISLCESSNAEWCQIESLVAAAHKIGLNLTDHAGELEPMSRTWARHKNAWIVRMPVDDEVVIRRIGKEADIALLHIPAGKLRQYRLERFPQRFYFTIAYRAIHFF